MKRCDLCYGQFSPPKGVAENSREGRYCHLCCTDPYRKLMCKIHETIGISGYTSGEIEGLKDDKIALLGVCKKVLIYIKHSEGEAPNGMRMMDAIEALESAINRE